MIRYETIKNQLGTPHGLLFKNNRGELCVRSNNFTYSLEDYLSYWSIAADGCEQDLLFFLRQADFTFEGFHNASSHRDEKNRKLQEKLENLIKKMALAKDLQSLNNLYHQINQLVDRMHVGYLSDRGKSHIRSFIENEEISDYYRQYGTMVSGLHLETVKNIERNGHINPEFIKAHIDTIYEQRKERINLLKQADRIQSVKTSSTVEHKQDNDQVQEKSDQVDENQESEIQEVLRRKEELHNERANLVHIRDEAYSELEELRREKFKLYNDANARGLYETETYEVPVYSHHTDPVDGGILFYQEETRYKNGSQEEREQHEKEVRRIENEIKKLEEKIEVLTESISHLDSQINFYRDRERELLNQMRSQALHAAEERFFGMSKLQQAMAKLSGKKELLRQLQESGGDLGYEGTMAQIEEVGRMFR